MPKTIQTNLCAALPGTCENSVPLLGPTCRDDGPSFLQMQHGLCPSSDSEPDEAIRACFETEVAGGI